MTNDTTGGVRPNACLLSSADDAEVDFVFAIDPFRDAVAALGIAIGAAVQAATGSTDPCVGLRPVVALVRGATNVVVERAAIFEQAARALLQAMSVT